jgi:vitamin B12 transporter
MMRAPAGKRVAVLSLAGALCHCFFARAGQWLSFESLLAMSLRTPVALALLLNAPLFALAQSASPASSSTDAPADYVVTATRSPQAAGSTVRPVQVITAEDIRTSGAGSLTDLLRTLGGVEVTRNGGLGQSSSIFMRGANADHTAVLIDGVRIGSATLGTAPLDAIPLALIERVEVLAGPSSSLYGGDAIGGVIQVFTKSAQRSPGLNLSLSAGQQGLRQVAAAYAGKLGTGTELSLGLNRLLSSGYNVTTAGNTDRDGYSNTGLNARLRQQLDGGHALSLQLLRSEGTVHYDGYADDGVDSLSRDRTQTLAVQWTGPLLPGVNSELRAARAWDDTAVSSTYTGTINSTQDQLSWLNRIALGGGTLTAGLEWLRQNVDSDTAYEVTSRTVRSALLGWRAGYGPVAVQADLRHDDNTQFGGHTTAQLGGAWQVDPALRLRASAGSAFKAPSFNLLYYPGFGVPTLQPERSTSLELGADAKLAGVDLGATLFDNRMRDLIDYAPPDYVPANVARAQTRGLALTASTALGRDTRAKLNLTVQSPENSDTGMQLRRRARQFAGLHLSHAMGPVSLGTDLSWVGHRYDATDESAASRMGGYGLVALFATWHVTPEWALEGRVNNLADKAYTTAQGYLPPGRNGQLTLRWTPAL